MHNKQRYFVACILFGFSTVIGAVPTIQHWQLENGAKVYFVPTEGLPILDVQLVFDAGSARDGNKLGVAALSSALLNQGAGDLSAQQIAEKIESVGAQLGASSSRDFSSITFRSLTDKQTLQTSWSVLESVLNTPSFPKKEFNRLKQSTLLAIKKRSESPGTLGQLALYEHIFNAHPYANPIQGRAASVEELDLGDIKKFYANHYVGNKSIIVLVGGISRNQAEALVNQLAGKLKSGEKSSPLAAVKPLSKGAVIQIDYPSQQTHLLYGVPVITHNDPDYFPLFVGNHILGGSGFSSRIVQEIREKRGLAYSAYSYFHPMVEKGPFLMGLQTRNEKAQEAIAALKQTLKAFIESGPSEDELIAAKKNISGGFALKLDSNKKLIGNVVSIVASGAPLSYLNTYLENIESITQKQIKEAFQRRINMDHMALVTVGQLADKEQ
ncbi:MAG: zinc protease [Cycloclasticus sp. symbiont of Poecilosclerida sp. M]|nr:MAG: zinc protease [Cycloclasticus sp. symbiont of Poecilosclerida sp. M]